MPGCRGVEIQRYGHGTICLFLRRWLHLRRPPSPAFFLPRSCVLYVFPSSFLFFAALSPYSFFLVDQEATDLGLFFFIRSQDVGPGERWWWWRPFFAIHFSKAKKPIFWCSREALKIKRGNQAVWFFLREKKTRMKKPEMLSREWGETESKWRNQ